MSNVAVRLDGDVLTEVGPDGRFEFGAVPVGSHTVELELVTVPASYDLGPMARAEVDVVRGTTAQVPFSLLQLGKVRGTVLVVDGAGDGLPVAPARDHPGAPMVVRLVGDRGDQRVKMTDDDGDFEFTSLQAGAYRLFVDAGSLPDHWSVASNAMFVTLTPGARVDDLQFVVAANPRPVRRVQLRQGSVNPSIDAVPPSSRVDEARLAQLAAGVAAVSASVPRAREGFSVQVGALSSRDSAGNLTAQLVAKGYPAAVVATDADAPVALFRIRVGPYEDRVEAEYVMRRLAIEEQFEPFVTRR